MSRSPWAPTLNFTADINTLTVSLSVSFIYLSVVVCKFLVLLFFIELHLIFPLLSSWITSLPSLSFPVPQPPDVTSASVPAPNLSDVSSGPAVRLCCCSPSSEVRPPPFSVSLCSSIMLVFSSVGWLMFISCFPFFFQCLVLILLPFFFFWSSASPRLFSPVMCVYSPVFLFLFLEEVSSLPEVVVDCVLLEPLGEFLMWPIIKLLCSQEK